MTEPSRVPPASTFVIRLWRVWSEGAGRWRGRIEHVQSGQRADFVEPGDILEFMRNLGVMAEDRISPCRPDE
jgi:hypothetical protein